MSKSNNLQLDFWEEKKEVRCVRALVISPMSP